MTETMIPQRMAKQKQKLEQMKNNLNLKKSIMQITIRGTTVTGKEAQCGRKQMTNIKIFAKSHEDFKRKIFFD